MDGREERAGRDVEIGCVVTWRQVEGFSSFSTPESPA
jgi:hypothetical protein